jgi:hypothetical protein
VEKNHEVTSEIGAGFMNLKEELQQLKQNDFIISDGYDTSTLIKNMLREIGSTDAELRDGLIYTTFYWIIERDILKQIDLQFIWDTCLDEYHLFYGIGDENSDSVFTRSFSSLVIALLIRKDKKHSFLTRGMYDDTWDKTKEYLLHEKDYRGYVDGKGWAHSIAHGADLLTELINHRFFDITQSIKYLDLIEHCIAKETVFTDGEDERLIYAIDALADKGLDESVLNDWIIKLSRELGVLISGGGYTLPYFKIRTNIISFLKSLFFRLLKRNQYRETRSLIEKIIIRSYTHEYE